MPDLSLAFKSKDEHVSEKGSLVVKAFTVTTRETGFPKGMLLTPKFVGSLSTRQGRFLGLPRTKPRN